MIRAVGVLLEWWCVLKGDEERSSREVDLTRKALEALVQLLDLCGVDIADISHQVGDLVISD
jgi:hypothetical protein